VSVLERFIGELQAVRAQAALESLTNPEDKTPFGYGQAVGRLEGLALAEATLNRLLNEPEVDADAGRRRSKT
jgi:hypothetical protein